MNKEPDKIKIVNAENFEILLRPVPRRGGILQLAPGQGEDGYGKKISSDYMLRFKDNPKQLYRVYCTCFSNAASHWIQVKGQTLHVDFWREDVIDESKNDTRKDETGTTSRTDGRQR